MKRTPGFGRALILSTVPILERVEPQDPFAGTTYR